jgi:hypothetical protein
LTLSLLLVSHPCSADRCSLHCVEPVHTLLFPGRIHSLGVLVLCRRHPHGCASPLHQICSDRALGCSRRMMRPTGTRSGLSPRQHSRSAREEHGVLKFFLFSHITARVRTSCKSGRSIGCTSCHVDIHISSRQVNSMDPHVSSTWRVFSAAALKRSCQGGRQTSSDGHVVWKPDHSLPHLSSPPACGINCASCG